MQAQLQRQTRRGLLVFCQGSSKDASGFQLLQQLTPRRLGVRHAGAAAGGPIARCNKQAEQLLKSWGLLKCSTWTCHCAC